MVMPAFYLSSSHCSNIRTDTPAATTAESSWPFVLKNILVATSNIISGDTYVLLLLKLNVIMIALMQKISFIIIVKI